jgi:hypothetical protein
MPLLRREPLRALEALGSVVEVSLTQREHAPIRPSGGFGRGSPRHSAETGVGARIIPDL